MIRLLLVDDQSLICQGLKAMLTLEPDLQVVGTADNGETAIEQVAALQPLGRHILEQIALCSRTDGLVDIAIIIKCT